VSGGKEAVRLGDRESKGVGGKERKKKNKKKRKEKKRKQSSTYQFRDLLTGGDHSFLELEKLLFQSKEAVRELLQLS
jgi:hypothetical protein